VRTLSVFAAPLVISAWTQKTFAFEHPTWQDALGSMGAEGWARAVNTATRFPSDTDPDLLEWFAREMGKSRVEVTRILAEQDAGRHVADVLALDVLRLPILREKGYLAQYLSREHRNYDRPWLSDPPGYWTENHVYLGGIMYNKKLVPPDKAPKSFEDLLKPEWKGKIAMVSPVANDLIFYMFAGLVRDMGEERAFRFFRALKDQGALVFGPGGIRVSQGVHTGEFSIGVGFIGHVYSVGGGDSGNMAFVPTNPTYALSGPGVCVMKNAPHPNAARLLADYMNSREAQEIVVDLGYFSNFRGLQAKSALTKLTVSVAPTPQGEKKDRLQERIKDALGL